MTRRMLVFLLALLLPCAMAEGGEDVRAMEGVRFMGRFNALEKPSAEP